MIEVAEAHGNRTHQATGNPKASTVLKEHVRLAVTIPKGHNFQRLQAHHVSRHRGRIAPKAPLTRCCCEIVVTQNEPPNGDTRATALTHRA